MEGSHPVGTYSEGAPELDLALNFTPPDLGGQKESAGSGAAVQQPATLSPGPVDAAQALLALGKRRAAADEENEGAPGRTQSIQGQKIKKGLPVSSSKHSAFHFASSIVKASGCRRLPLERSLACPGL